MSGQPVRSVLRAGLPRGPVGYLIALAALLTWLVKGWAPDNTRFWDAVFDLGHAGLFAVMTGLSLRLAEQVAPRSTDRARLLSVFVLMVAVGALTELAQMSDPIRHPSVGDALRDTAGSGVFLALWLVVHGKVSRSTTFALTALSALAAVAVLIPFLSTIFDYRARDRAFPTLVALDGSPWERRFVETIAVAIRPRAQPTLVANAASAPFALVTFYPDPFAGFAVAETYPDWSDYDRLEFEAIVPGSSPLTIMIRATDRWFSGDERDRFNRTLDLRPGLQTISIALRDIASSPSARVLRLSQMRRVSIVAHHLSRSEAIYLSPVRLTRTGR